MIHGHHHMTQSLSCVSTTSDNRKDNYPWNLARYAYVVHKSFSLRRHFDRFLLSGGMIRGKIGVSGGDRAVFLQPKALKSFHVSYKGNVIIKHLYNPPGVEQYNKHHVIDIDWFSTYEVEIWRQVKTILVQTGICNVDPRRAHRMKKMARTLAETIFQILLPLPFQNSCPFQHSCNHLFSWHFQTPCHSPCQQSAYFRVFVPRSISCPRERSLHCLLSKTTSKKNTCLPFQGTLAERLHWGSRNTCRNHAF